MICIMLQILVSAAWIVGEYSSILTNIYHDSDENGEERYLIDAPFDKSVYSTWRGKFIHYLIISVLLHPIVGACLSSKVQATYLTAAMKIFVEGIQNISFHN
jgi:hypothetical protein